MEHFQEKKMHIKICFICKWINLISTNKKKNKIYIFICIFSHIFKINVKNYIVSYNKIVSHWFNNFTFLFFVRQLITPYSTCKSDLIIIIFSKLQILIGFQILRWMLIILATCRHINSTPSTQQNENNTAKKGHFASPQYLICTSSEVLSKYSTKRCRLFHRRSRRVTCAHSRNAV